MLPHHLQPRTGKPNTTFFLTFKKEGDNDQRPKTYFTNGNGPLTAKQVIDVAGQILPAMRQGTSCEFILNNSIDSKNPLNLGKLQQFYNGRLAGVFNVSAIRQEQIGTEFVDRPVESSLMAQQSGRQ